MISLSGFSVSFPDLKQELALLRESYTKHKNYRETMPKFTTIILRELKCRCGCTAFEASSVHQFARVFHRHWLSCDVVFRMLLEIELYPPSTLLKSVLQVSLASHLGIILKCTLGAKAIRELTRRVVVLSCQRCRRRVWS